MQEKLKKINLKSGLEIHQQLDTSKLFCKCPSILRTDEPDFVVKRKLRAVAGESGEIDIAARYEQQRQRQFIYQAYNDTTCLVELDECPPMEINQQALKIVLQISVLLNAKILSVTQIMRKTVVDGSNTSGFQRTVLIARDGYVKTEQGRVGIQTIALEEDAARIINISKEKNTKTFRLDRLGIPLIEIATAPEIKNPEQAKQVALHIGEILRACKVRRGIGTIRQDVNMSIPGGARIEIKGVQEPRLIVKTIKTETQRQKQFIEQGKSKPEVRKANPDGTTSFLRPLPGAARMYPETDLPLLKIPRELINEVKRTLPKLKHETRAELRSKGLNEEMIKLLFKEKKLEQYEALLKLYNKPNFIVKALILWPKEISSHYKIQREKLERKLSVDIIETVIEAVSKNKIPERAAKHVMEEVAQGKKVKEAIREVKEKPKQTGNLEEEILKLIKEKPGLSVKAYMGLIMKKHKGKVSGKQVMEILKKLVK